MKSKEAAAKEYSIEQIEDTYETFVNRINLDSYYGFLSGISFAESWISVRDELPINQDIVLVKTDKECYATAYLHGEKSGFIVYGDDAYKEFGEIKFWRPINRI